MADDSPLKILLVEDDEVDRMAFERFVLKENLPYKVSIAVSVAEATEQLAHGDFDAILLDFNLGDGTGFDVIDQGPDAPVILITGANQTDIAVAAMKAGAYDYLVKDQDRNYLQVLPIAVDSAIHRKETEKSRTILGHAVMSAPDCILITDLDENITFVNSSVVHTYDYPEDELLGCQLSMIGESATDGEHLHRCKDGGEFPVSVSRSLVKDESGREIAIVVQVTDITEQKRAEEELKRINRELEGYAHTVSHDLKGPLASTVLAMDTLKMLMEGLDFGDKDDKIAMLMKIVDNNVWKSAALIDDLLALAEAGQTPDTLIEVDIAGIVTRVLDERAGAIGERRVEVVVGNDLGTVVGSPTHFYQLFTNLIGNCLKHCQSDQPLVQVIRLDGADDGDLKTYLVRDNGVGIPEEDLKTIFDPFFKGTTGGTGIGLATVEKIVKLYGGAIRAYNDAGACFEFTIGDYRPK
jgi:PAS domain S-box-containing protein